MITNDGNAYNRFVNLDGAEYRIFDFLAKSESKYADNLWKILAYDTEDCLLRPSLSYEERMNLLYVNNGNANIKRAFMSPYIDDSWVEQSSHLHIYVHSVIPKDHITSTVNIGIECIVHNKISNIISDANIFNDSSNPSELHNGDGSVIVKYKSRATVMLKSVLAALNGYFIAGVGTLQLNYKVSGYDMAKMSLWNNRSFFGYEVVMSTLLSGVSTNEECGY